LNEFLGGTMLVESAPEERNVGSSKMSSEQQEAQLQTLIETGPFYAPQCKIHLG
jgi:hypothetical protein